MHATPAYGMNTDKIDVTKESIDELLSIRKKYGGAWAKSQIRGIFIGLGSLIGGVILCIVLSFVIPDPVASPDIIKDFFIIVILLGSGTFGICVAFLSIKRLLLGIPNPPKTPEEAVDRFISRGLLASDKPLVTFTCLLRQVRRTVEDDLETYEKYILKRFDTIKALIHELNVNYCCTDIINFRPWHEVNDRNKIKFDLHEIDCSQQEDNLLFAEVKIKQSCDDISDIKKKMPDHFLKLTLPIVCVGEYWFVGSIHNDILICSDPDNQSEIPFAFLIDFDLSAQLQDEGGIYQNAIQLAAAGKLTQALLLANKVLMKKPDDQKYMTLMAVCFAESFIFEYLEKHYLNKRYWYLFKKSAKKAPDGFADEADEVIDKLNRIFSKELEKELEVIIENELIDTIDDLVELGIERLSVLKQKFYQKVTEIVAHGISTGNHTLSTKYSYYLKSHKDASAVLWAQIGNCYIHIYREKYEHQTGKEKKENKYRIINLKKDCQKAFQKALEIDPACNEAMIGLQAVEQLG